jgi:hypothetical protein
LTLRQLSRWRLTVRSFGFTLPASRARSMTFRAQGLGGKRVAYRVSGWGGSSPARPAAPRPPFLARCFPPPNSWHRWAAWASVGVSALLLSSIAQLPSMPRKASSLVCLLGYTLASARSSSCEELFKSDNAGGSSPRKHSPMVFQLILLSVRKH